MVEEKYTFKLLVEGNDDKHVVIALWNNAKLPETFDVIDCQSITKLLDNLRIRLTAPQTNERLGVVVDADIAWCLLCRLWCRLRHQIFCLRLAEGSIP